MAPAGVVAQPAGRSDPPDPIEQRVARELTVSMVRSSALPLVVGNAIAVLIALLLWDKAAPALVGGWLAAKLATAALRLAHIHRCGAEPASIQETRRLYLWLLVPDALLWGAIGVLFAPPGGDLGGLMLAVVVGSAAGGAVSTGSDRLGGAIYLGGVLSPVAMVHAWQGTLDGALIAIGLALYGVLLAGDAGKIRRRFVAQTRLRYENERIADEQRRATLLAEHSSAAKSRFLAAVSHELRTPLNGIVGMAELLRRGTLDDGQRAKLDIMRGSARHLQTVIGDLLDLSRIEADRLTIEQRPFAVERSVREVTDLLAPLAEAKSLAFELSFAPGVPAAVLGDAPRVKQVLHNLIGNAIKFTQAGHVRLHVEPTAGGLRFTVSDTGPGIALGQHERIFEAFEQAPGGSHAGLGLGLTISRRLARAMGGDVRLQSLPHAGARFAFDIAATTAPLPVDDDALPVVDAPLHAHVLVAEDNEVNALVARSMLQALGCTVDTVDDGAAALRQLRIRRYDAVLMDCQMPQLDGWAATRRWRSEERESGARRLPIVALTANAVAGDRERCLAAGMDGYLAKPFELAALRTVLARALAGRADVDAEMSNR